MGNGADDGGGVCAATAICSAVVGEGAASPCWRALSRAPDNVDRRRRLLTVTLPAAENG